MTYKTILTISAAAATWLSAAGGQSATTLDDLVEPGAKFQVIGTGYGFCEGPTADAQGNVYFSDGMNDSIYYYQPGKPVVRFIAGSTDANGEKINSRGELYTCEGVAHRVVAFNVRTKEKRVLCSRIDGVHFNEPNDLTIDRFDGFYFTDPCFAHRNQKAVMKEAIYYCSPQGVVTRVSTVCQKPNGVQLTPDEKTIYLADWGAGRIFKCDVVAPGKLANQRKWIDLGANPDGLTLDHEGNVYAGCGGAGVKVCSPEGRVIGVIKVGYVSNLCFGGPDFKTLYLTSIDKFLALPMKVVGIKPLPLRVKQ
jgi:gluconolactonase